MTKTIIHYKFKSGSVLFKKFTGRITLAQLMEWCNERNLVYLTHDYYSGKGA